MNNQYDQFISKENFILAYMRLKTVKRNEYKEFYYHDFKVFEEFFDSNIDQLIHEVIDGIYNPSACEKYYMPKKKNLARPITMLCLLDQIVYQAIANVIADLFYPYMSPYFNVHTFGNIFIATTADNNIFFYERWKEQWKRFKQSKNRAYKEGYAFTAEFDIASFYDTIDHHVLVEILKEYSVDTLIIDLFSRCLSSWTVSPSSTISFNKSSGIPQGPVSSPFFAEIYLMKIDSEMRKRKAIKYMRYADDISIMAKTQEECQKMIVYLDLLSRDFSLIPQSEKIGVSYIDNIDKHINDVTIKFSNILKEYIRNGYALKDKTHNKLKRRFLSCIDSGDYNKTFIKFVLFKLNRDDEIKNAIIQNISNMELFYEGIIYYFDKHYTDDPDFIFHIMQYLLGDTVLFQYNKSLLFKNYKALHYDEKIFRKNFQEQSLFWIVLYQLIGWLSRCNKDALAIEAYKGSNYYIKRSINNLKVKHLECEDIEAKRIFLEELISDKSPLLSLQGIYLWYQQPWINKPETITNNGYAKRILSGCIDDYFTHEIKTLYGLDTPQSFIEQLSADEIVFKEAKDNLRLFVNKRAIDPEKSIMNLDLLHNIMFDILSATEGYNIDGDFGGNLSQLKEKYPIAYIAFDRVHQMRNQRTEAHYKDKKGRPRKRLKQSEYEELLATAKLSEAYGEVFEVFTQN